MMSEPTPIQNAEEYAARSGYVITEADRAAMHAIRLSERARLAESRAASTSGIQAVVARFNAFYPRLLESIAGIGDVLITLVQTVLVSFGVPIALYLLMRVEITRVTHGLQLFESEVTTAEFGATALVIVNLILEFVVMFVEHREGYKSESATRFSLRIVAGNWAYRLGLGSEWKPRALSPAQWARNVLWWITVTILALALFGSMRDVLGRVEGNWFAGIASIVTTSTLSQMATWIGGLLFAIAAVLTAQRLSRYMAIRCAEIIESMRARSAGVDAQLDAMAEHSAAQHLIATVRAAKNAQKALPKPQPASVSLDPTQPVQTVRRTRTDTDGRREMVLKYLDTTPGAAAMSVRAIAEATGVGKTLAAEVKSDWLANVADETKPTDVVQETN